ncbi:MAG: IMP dehydrogenase, partial [Bdellovibrionaceae bacterium]|nr:IMP dehydrogenase [Pseudobdellovibrionaceae bacterium]
MELFFNWKEIKNKGRGLTFDDVLIVPAKSDVRSRKDPSLATQLTKNKKVNLPIISANMDTVTESDMALAMWQLGGVGILHRFMTIEDQIKNVIALKTQ